MSPQKLPTAQHSQQHLLVPHLRSTNARAQFTARFWKQVIELLQGLPIDIYVPTHPVAEGAAPLAYSLELQLVKKWTIVLENYFHR